MSTPYPAYYVIDGQPYKATSATEVLSLDPATGRMVPSDVARQRTQSAQPTTKDAYMTVLGELRQPIIERYATAPLVWQLNSGGANDEPYQLTVDGHHLIVRQGDFPDEPMYLVLVDGDIVFSLDSWPNAWKMPSEA